MTPQEKNRLALEAASKSPLEISQLLAGLGEFPKNPIRHKKRLGIFIDDLHAGGAARLYTSLISEWVIRGYEIFLFTLEEPCPKDFPVPPVHRFVLPREEQNKYNFIKDICEKYELDLINLYFHPQAVSLFLYFKLLGCTVVVTVHHQYLCFKIINTLDVHFPIETYLLPHADAVTILSRKEAYLWQQWKAKAIYMPNILAFNSNTITQSPLKEPLIVWIGRFGKEKQPIFALEAFHRALPHCPKGTKFIMLGDGDLLKPAQKFVKDHGLDAHVEFLGFIDPRPALSRASLHLFTSASESFALVLGETKAYGIPTLMFELPHLEMAQVPGSFSVPQGDTSALAEGMAHLLGNPEELRLLGGQALQSLEHFNTGKTMDRWDSLYEALANNTFSVDIFPWAIECTPEMVQEYITDIKTLMLLKPPIVEPPIVPESVHKLHRILNKLLPKTGVPYRILRFFYHLIRR